MARRDPQSEPPTVDRIRADISGGRTREKVDFPEPAAAPLGTDDEAAGTASTLKQRQMEDQQWPNPEPPPDPPKGPVIFYFSFAAVLAIAIMCFAMTKLSP